MLRKKQTVISWDSRENRMLTVSALCKEGCNWSREKWRESRKPLWLNRESDWSRYRNDEIWHQFLSTSAAGHKWWRLLADSDVPSLWSLLPPGHYCPRLPYRGLLQTIETTRPGYTLRVRHCLIYWKMGANVHMWEQWLCDFYSDVRCQVSSFGGNRRWTGDDPQMLLNLRSIYTIFNDKIWQVHDPEPTCYIASRQIHYHCSTRSLSWTLSTHVGTARILVAVFETEVVKRRRADAVET